MKQVDAAVVIIAKACCDLRMQMPHAQTFSLDQLLRHSAALQLQRYDI